MPVDMTEVIVDYTSLLGKSGTAVTNLRPVGVVEIEGKRYDVRTHSTFLPAGTKVSVVTIEDNVAIVQPIE